MRRREKPEPITPEGGRPCGFAWQKDPDDGHLFAARCACGRPYIEHDRYTHIWRKMAAVELGPEVIRKQLARALANRVEANQRTWPLHTGLLGDNGHRRRFLLESETILADE